MARRREELANLVCDKPDVTIVQAGEETHPEGALRNDIGIGEIAKYAIIPSTHVRLTYQVSTKQQPGADLIGIEELRKLLARKSEIGRARSSASSMGASCRDVTRSRKGLQGTCAGAAVTAGL